jgi:hypothetical protein
MRSASKATGPVPYRPIAVVGAVRKTTEPSWIAKLTGTTLSRPPSSKATRPMPLVLAHGSPPVVCVGFPSHRTGARRVQSHPSLATGPNVPRSAQTVRLIEVEGVGQEGGDVAFPLGGVGVGRSA